MHISIAINTASIMLRFINQVLDWDACLCLNDDGGKETQ
jgi:hypothetical protein